MTWIATYNYLEGAEIQFDVMAGFEITHHRIHGIGVYAAERDPWRKTYGDDLLGPALVCAQWRGENTTVSAGFRCWSPFRPPKRDVMKTCPA